MKSKYFVGMVFLFFFIGSGLYAQSHNNEQRLLGTWTIENDYHPSASSTETGNTWTFNQNGTFSVGNRSGKWAIAGNTIAFWNFEFSGSYSFFISPDGRSLYVPGVASFNKR